MRTSTSAFTLVALLGVAAPASADPSDDARAKFREGRALFARREYAAARAAFDEAYRILPNPRVLANVAACFAEEGRPAEAVHAYRRFLREGGIDAPEAARREAQREIESLRPRVGDLLLAVEPSGAEVLVDGERIGEAPLPWPLALAPGEHLVEVRAPDLAPFSRTLNLEAGQEANVSVVLERVAAQPAPAAAVPAEPEGRTAAPSRPAAPRETEAPLGRGPLLWTGIGLTVLLAAGGAVTGLLTLSRKNEYEDPETSLPRRNDLYDSTRTLALTTDILVDAAIVTGLATAALYLVAGPDDPEETAVATLHLYQGGATCGISLSF